MKAPPKTKDIIMIRKYMKYKHCQDLSLNLMQKWMSVIVVDDVSYCCTGRQDTSGRMSSGGDPLPMYRLLLGVRHIHAAAHTLPCGSHGGAATTVPLQCLQQELLLCYRPQGSYWHHTWKSSGQCWQKWEGRQAGRQADTDFVVFLFICSFILI